MTRRTASDAASDAATAGRAVAPSAGAAVTPSVASAHPAAPPLLLPASLPEWLTVDAQVHQAVLHDEALRARLSACVAEAQSRCAVALLTHLECILAHYRLRSLLVQLASPIPASECTHLPAIQRSPAFQRYLELAYAERPKELRAMQRALNRLGNWCMLALQWERSSHHISNLSLFARLLQPPSADSVAADAAAPPVPSQSAAAREPSLNMFDKLTPLLSRLRALDASWEDHLARLQVYLQCTSAKEMVQRANNDLTAAQRQLERSSSATPASAAASADAPSADMQVSSDSDSDELVETPASASLIVRSDGVSTSSASPHSQPRRDRILHGSVAPAAAHSASKPAGSATAASGFAEAAATSLRALKSLSSDVEVFDDDELLVPQHEATGSSASPRKRKVGAATKEEEPLGSYEADARTSRHAAAQNSQGREQAQDGCNENISCCCCHCSCCLRR